MYALSQQIYTILTTDAAVIAALGTAYLKKVAPLLIEQDTAEPFVVYRVSVANSATKDGVKNYSLNMRVYHTNYNKAVQLSETIEAAFLAASNPYFLLLNATAVADETGKVYVEINYKLKK